MPQAGSRLSVIIPTFERPAATIRAVESVLAQDVGLEVLVVDDGSRAPFTFAHGPPHLKIIRLADNMGPAYARNLGVAEAQGDWIALLDSDDVWPAGSLKPRFEAARRDEENAETTIWTAGFVDVFPNSAARRVRVPRDSRSLLDFASGCWTCPGSTALMSREAWSRSGGQDETLRRLEDYEWLLRWGAGGGRVAAHRGVGAEITRGGRARVASIDAAAARIRALHADQPEAVRRRMESYLLLEAGAARLHAGAYVGGLAALARSWALRPRLRAALEPFWARA